MKKAAPRMSGRAGPRRCALSHQPNAAPDPTHPAHQRLAYDELFANQLALALIRHWMRSLPGRAFEKSSALRGTALAACDFR